MITEPLTSRKLLSRTKWATAASSDLLQPLSDTPLKQRRVSRILAVCALTVMCLGLSRAAAADANIDVGSLTCTDFGKMLDSKSSTTALMFWLDGYLSGVSGDTTLRSSVIGTFTENLTDVCAKAPYANLLTMAKQIGLRHPPAVDVLPVPVPVPVPEHVDAVPSVPIGPAGRRVNF